MPLTPPTAAPTSAWPCSVGKFLCKCSCSSPQKLQIPPLTTTHASWQLNTTVLQLYRAKVPHEETIQATRSPRGTGEEHQACTSAKAEQKKPSIPSHPLWAASIPMVWIYFCFLPVVKFHAQFVVLNQPNSRTTGPEGSDFTHPQKPWAAGPAA